MINVDIITVKCAPRPQPMRVLAMFVRDRVLRERRGNWLSVRATNLRVAQEWNVSEQLLFNELVTLMTLKGDI